SSSLRTPVASSHTLRSSCAPAPRFPKSFHAALRNEPMDRSIDNDPREPDERTDLEQDRPVEQDAPVIPRPYEIAQLRERIDYVTRDHRTLSELLDRLGKIGIRPVPSIQKNGRLNGMSYEWTGVRYRGSEVGRGYTASGLKKAKGIRYDPERDDTRLREAE